MFQHTAARRRLVYLLGEGFGEVGFQHTAARRRLVSCAASLSLKRGFQHTAARRRLAEEIEQTLAACEVSTHSRPKAAGKGVILAAQKSDVSTHSRPKAAGAAQPFAGSMSLFQHTAARRRLVVRPNRAVWCIWVSTHSRPKAAGLRHV